MKSKLNKKAKNIKNVLESQTLSSILEQKLGFEYKNDAENVISDSNTFNSLLIKNQPNSFIKKEFLEEGINAIMYMRKSYDEIASGIESSISLLKLSEKLQSKYNEGYKSEKDSVTKLKLKYIKDNNLMEKFKSYLNCNNITIPDYFLEGKRTQKDALDYDLYGYTPALVQLYDITKSFFPIDGVKDPYDLESENFSNDLQKILKSQLKQLEKFFFEAKDFLNKEYHFIDITEIEEKFINNLKESNKMVKEKNYKYNVLPVLYYNFANNLDLKEKLKDFVSPVCFDERVSRSYFDSIVEYVPDIHIYLDIHMTKKLSFRKDILKFKN